MFEAIIDALVAARVRFVVVGGVAATIQGSARFTNDIDLCYDTSRGNIERLVRLLSPWRPYLRGVGRGLPFVFDVRGLETSPIMTLTTVKGDIDLLDRIPGVGDYAAAVAASEVATVGSVEFRSLRLESLIASKRVSRRPKDLEHLIELEALLALRRKLGHQ